MTSHKFGTREEWLAARLELLDAEKELTRRSDEVARQRRRKCRLTGVSSYTPAAITTTPAATYPCGRYSAYPAAPSRAQTIR